MQFWIIGVYMKENIVSFQYGHSKTCKYMEGERAKKRERER